MTTNTEEFLGGILLMTVGFIITWICFAAF